MRGYALGELVAYHGNTLGPVEAWRTVCHYTRADHPAVKAAVVEAVRAVPQRVPATGQLVLF